MLLMAVMCARRDGDDNMKKVIGEAKLATCIPIQYTLTSTTTFAHKSFVVLSVVHVRSQGW